MVTGSVGTSSDGSVDGNVCVVGLWRQIVVLAMLVLMVMVFPPYFSCCCGKTLGLKATWGGRIYFIFYFLYITEELQSRNLDARTKTEAWRNANHWLVLPAFL